MAENLQTDLEKSQLWLNATDKHLANAPAGCGGGDEDEKALIREKHGEMAAMRDRVKNVQA